MGESETRELNIVDTVDLTEITKRSHLAAVALNEYIAEYNQKQSVDELEQ